MSPKKKLIYAVATFLLLWFIVMFKLNSLVQPSSFVPVHNVSPVILSDEYIYNVFDFKRHYSDSISVDSSSILGINGAAVKTLAREKDERDKRFNLHMFNEYVSSKISLLRKLPEKRRGSCFQRKFPTKLPTASIVIIYHNEAWSTLLRTVHTALSRSPDYLLNEVILVDDLSNYEKFPHLGKELDDHFRGYKKVKIIRSPTRIGLTVARLVGARNATGDVLIFLDSHCECFDGWIEPLLLDIKENPRVAFTPVIEVIDLETFAVNGEAIKMINVGTFTWKMDFTWFIPPNQDMSYKPIRSPTMAGGLFAIKKDFFFEVGSYDNKMTYWGSENLEISFRLWMCADGVFSDPCSIVGHVFRKNSPHDLAQNSVHLNKHRLVEVWLEDYRNVAYNAMGSKDYDQRAGSVEERLDLKVRLNCKSFKWYLDNISTNIRVPGIVTEIRNPKTNLCFDSANSKNGNTHSNIALLPCHKQGGNQAFEVLRVGTIIANDVCLDLSKAVDGAEPILYTCHNLGGNQKWQFKGKSIIHEIYSNCLEAHEGSKTLTAHRCDPDNERQHWEYNFSS